MTALEKFHEKNKKKLLWYRTRYPGRVFIFVRGAWAYIYDESNIIKASRADVINIIRKHIFDRKNCAIVETTHDEKVYESWRKRCFTLKEYGDEFYLATIHENLF